MANEQLTLDKRRGNPDQERSEALYEAVKGAVKEKVGHVIGDKKMERRGAAEHRAGDVRLQVGKIKRKVGETNRGRWKVRAQVDLGCATNQEVLYDS